MLLLKRHKSAALCLIKWSHVWATIAYLILARLRSIKIKLPIQAIASIFILSILFVFLGFVSANKRVTSKYAVVIEHEAPLMLSPETGKSQSLIPEGTKVEVTDNKTGWLEVILPDGRTGWLQSNTLGRI